MRFLIWQAAEQTAHAAVTAAAAGQEAARATAEAAAAQVLPRAHD